MGNSAYTASFARIYDDIMGTVPYKLWYDYIHDIMNFYQLKAEDVLDLACGTANMSLLFAKNSYQVTGLDKSTDMLTVAKEKVKKAGVDINFINANLSSFSTEEKFDLAISLFDSLNYILDIADLKKVFANVYNVLKETGYFIFDVNTIDRLMSIKPGSTVFNGDDYSCIWEDIIDKEKKLWQVRLKIYLKNLGEYFEEFHQEKGYKISILKKVLYEVGFTHIDVYNAYTLTEASDKDNRVYFIAFKNKSMPNKKPVIVKSVKNVKWGFKRLINSFKI